MPVPTIQEQLDAIATARLAIITGKSATVSINGRSVTFHTLTELDRAEQSLLAQQAAASGAQHARFIPG